MDKLYEGVRIAIMIFACLGFYTVAYKGVRVYIDQREQYNWAVFLLGFWFFLAAYGQGEQLYSNVKPGPRTFATLVLVVCSFVYVLGLKAPYARKP